MERNQASSFITFYLIKLYFLQPLVSVLHFCDSRWGQIIGAKAVLSKLSYSVLRITVSSWPALKHESFLWHWMVKNTKQNKQKNRNTTYSFTAWLVDMLHLSLRHRVYTTPRLFRPHDYSLLSDQLCILACSRVTVSVWCIFFSFCRFHFFCWKPVLYHLVMMIIMMMMMMKSIYRSVFCCHDVLRLAEQVHKAPSQWLCITHFHVMVAKIRLCDCYGQQSKPSYLILVFQNQKEYHVFDSFIHT